MHHNDVRDLLVLPDDSKQISCKWTFKIKRNLKGNVESFKARFVAKGFTQ